MGLIVCGSLLLFRKKSSEQDKGAVSQRSKIKQKIEEKTASQRALSQSDKSSEVARPAFEKKSFEGQQVFKKAGAKANTDSKNLITYTIEDGIAVTQGDIIIGELDPEAGLSSASGQVLEPQIKTWPTNEIPYFVQADLPHKERVIEALQMFSGTRVRFIPYNNHSDAIVFERKDGICKSYVGYIGGLQKIYLSDQCGPTEVAHEIMHSLGFVHEQNRYDRDQFIQIFWENIEPKEKVNFEKFSGSAMKASGAAAFDFQSIMMYPETMFSSNQNPTMRPVAEGQRIMPSEVLSPKDVERINLIY